MANRVDSTAPSPYIAPNNNIPIQGNVQNIVSLSYSDPDSLNIANLQENAYITACNGLCLDIEEKLAQRPKLKEILIFLTNHQRYLAKGVERPKDCSISLKLGPEHADLERALDRFDENDPNLFWEGNFPQVDGECGNCYRCVDEVHLCHYTFIKGPNKGNFQSTIAHPMFDAFEDVKENCQELWDMILDPTLPQHDVDEYITSLHWWLAQWAPFKTSATETDMRRGKRPLNDGLMKNYNGTFIEITIAALRKHKLQQRPRSYTDRVNSYHLAITTSREEFKRLYHTLFR